MFQPIEYGSRLCGNCFKMKAEHFPSGDQGLLCERPKRKKWSYIGAPAHFKLEQACQQISEAFGGYGCYLVGSALERADFRDVDIRYILSDEDFERLFPGTGWSAEHPHGALWEHNPRWLLMTISICEWLQRQTGLPVDFQFQPQSHANALHRGRRHAIGMMVKHEP